MLRLLAVSAAVLVALAIVGAVGFYFLQGWRARDLAGKALENLEQTNYRMAWMQMNSARSLRPDDPAVLRSAAIIESRFGMPSAMESWDGYAAKRDLSQEDLVERGRAAAALGNEDQFKRAVDGLDAAGYAASAGRLRTVRSLARGNVDRAIEEVRRAAASTEDPAMKLDLARLLLRRNVDQLATDPGNPETERVAGEIFAIVDSLQGTKVGDEALAFGLTFLLPGKEEQKRWAALAMRNMQPDNPALLPAATVMVDLGEAKPQDLLKTLRPMFDAAPLERRAALVHWLTRQGIPREALTLITSQEAGESAEAFTARTQALLKLENWDAVIDAADAGGNVPLSTRLAVKARAEYARRKDAQSGAKSLSDALRAAARESNVPAVVAFGDEMGANAVVDATLVELCGDPAVSDQVFRLSRDRFSRRGESASALLASAHDRALAVAPNAVSVQDYSRYLRLIAPAVENESEQDRLARRVDPAETARAVAAAPADLSLRATHALVLLESGKPEDALAAFNDLTLYYGRMPPSIQAVICRVLAAAGQRDAAYRAAQVIDKKALTEQEKQLLTGLLPPRDGVR